MAPTYQNTVRTCSPDIILSWQTCRLLRDVGLLLQFSTFSLQIAFSCALNSVFSIPPCHNSSHCLLFGLNLFFYNSLFLVFYLLKNFHCPTFINLSPACCCAYCTMRLNLLHRISRYCC